MLSRARTIEISLSRERGRERDRESLSRDIRMMYSKKSRGGGKDKYR